MDVMSENTQKYTWQPYEYTEENCKQACFKNPQSLDLALLCCPAVMICIVIVFLQNMNFIDLCNVIVRNRVKRSANNSIFFLTFDSWTVLIFSASEIFIGNTINVFLSVKNGKGSVTFFYIVIKSKLLHSIKRSTGLKPSQDSAPFIAKYERICWFKRAWKTGRLRCWYK